MGKLHFLLAATFLTFLSGVPGTTWGRGFGGMHMTHGGGMHRGGVRPAPRMGGAHFGGARPNMRSIGGERGRNIGGARAAGARAGGAGAGGLNEFRGSRAGFDGGPLGSGSLAGGGLSHLGFPGGSAAGFGKANRGAGPLATRNPLASRDALGRSTGALDRSRGAVGGSRGELDRSRGTLNNRGGALGASDLRAKPSRSKLGNFLGLPSDGGMHALASHRSGLDQRGHQRRPAADLARHAERVRHDFRGRGFYNRDWYRRYPGAWYPGGWAYGDVWAVVTWEYMNGWFDYDNEDPVYYDYGNTVTYQDNSVYMNGQDMGTAAEYYQQAEDLADAGAQTDDDQAPATGDEKEWLPLGVFAMSHDQQTKANLILQLAVNKAGIIRGNYTATLTNDTKTVQGSVDKKTQRAAWTIGDNKDNVIETGIYNLTKDEAPCLVHFGKDKTEQWTLVRLNKDDSSSATTDAKP